MASCGVVAGEAKKLGRDLSKLDLGNHRTTPKRDSSIRPQYTVIHGGGSHEAIRFLQAEHEKVLAGIHKEMRSLQQKCDGLQFEAHLRHLVDNDDSHLKIKVSQLTETLEDKESIIQELRKKLDQQQKETDELAMQNRWNEVKLLQQIEAGEQKIVDLKEECDILRAKVRDLKVYSAALRRGSGSDKALSNSPRSASRSSILEDSNDGPFSLESEDSFSGSWKEARLAASNQPVRRQRKLSAVSVDKPFLLYQQEQQRPDSPSSSFDLASMSMPAKIRRPSSRPGSVILPPINLSQSVGRPQFRQHMRFASAPPTESNSMASKRRISDASPQRRKYAD